jgi:uncharacterized membrane protein required for colicin V production
MSQLDTVLLVILAFYAYLGYRRGLIAVLLDWLSLGVAVAAALGFAGGVGTWLVGRYSLWLPVARVLAFVGLLLGARLVMAIAMSLVWRRIPRAVAQSSVNRAAGILPGLLQGAMVIALGLLPLAALPIPGVPRAAIARSPLAGALLRGGAAAQAEVLRRMGGSARDLIGFRPPPLKEDESVDLPFRTTQAAPDPEAEAAMLHLVNVERRRRGLEPLRPDERLRQAARRHSRDMLARGYFSHHSPDGQGPFDRLQAAGVHYVNAGENLAFAPDVQTAHAGLMESPGHRANILRPTFGRVGIGALRAAPYGVMLSQEFTN